MDAKSWIERVAQEPPATVAKKIGISPTTLDSQMKSPAGLKPDTVVRIARKYAPDAVVASLVELGLITADEAGGEVDLTELDHLAWLADEKKATDDLLLREIGRRLEERRGGAAGDEGGNPAEPVDPDPKPAPADELTKKRTQRQRPAPNLPVTRSARPKGKGKPKMGDEE